MRRFSPALRRENIAAVLAFAIALCSMAAMLARKADEPLRHYGHGYWAEARFLLSAQRFAEEGFLAARLAPHLQIGPLDEAPLGQTYPYLHSQPAVYLAGGALWTLGLRTIAGFRLLSLLFHAAGVACFFFLARRFMPPPAAAFAAALFCFSPPVYLHADSPVMHGYVWLLTLAPVLLWLHFAGRGEAVPLRTFVAVNALFLVQGLFLLIEYWLFAHALLWLLALAFGAPKRKIQLLWLAPGHALAVLLTLARNAWYLGPGEAARDLLGVFVGRIWGKGMSAVSEETFSWAAWAGRFFERFPDTFAGFRSLPHAEKLFLAALVVSAIWLLLRRERAGETNSASEFARALRFALALFAAGAAYHLLFAQAAMVHYFPIGDLSPGVCAALAAFIGGGVAWIRSRLGETGGARLAPVLFAAVGICAVALNANYCARFERDPQFVGQFEAAAAVDRLLPENAVVGHSTFLPAVIYYARRPFVMAVETPEALENFRERAAKELPGRPLYFVMAPPVRGDVQALWKHLDTRYPRVLEVPALRLTVYNLNIAPQI